MSQEDKPASVRRPTIDDHLNTFARACAFGDVESRRYAADAIKAMVQSQPVAALEPIAWMSRDGVTASAAEVESNTARLPKSSFTIPLGVINNATPCARCDRLNNLLKTEKRMFDLVSRELQITQAKITMQADSYNSQPPAIDRDAVIDDDMVARMQGAIEGEFDGVALDAQHAKAIIEYVFGGALKSKAQGHT